MRNSPTKRRRKRARKPVSASEITTFQVAQRYLEARVNYEHQRITKLDPADFKLGRMQSLLGALQNPQEDLKFVHVAGTVGKGSTIAMISALLSGCGYVVGQYTSPHLQDFRERISINGELIDKGSFTELVQQVAVAANQCDIDPTYFEVLTAVSMLYFVEQAVDIAIIETGLGGRLDSTNAINPIITVITCIAHDHTHLLGDTLEEIAAEKCGILKQGVPLVSYCQTPEVDEVIRTHAEKLEVSVHTVGGTLEFSHRFGASAGRAPHCRVCLGTRTHQYMHLPVPLPGDHQAVNCGMAVAAVDLLDELGFPVEEIQMLRGLETIKIPGRMDLVNQVPKILVDGAHNPVALFSLMKCIGNYIPYDSMVCIFGCCEDKDIPSMLKEVIRGGDKIIFTRARHNRRAMDPEELQHIFLGLNSGKMSQVADSLPDAIALAKRAVSRDDIICITGSFYLAGEAMSLIDSTPKIVAN